MWTPLNSWLCVDLIYLFSRVEKGTVVLGLKVLGSIPNLGGPGFFCKELFFVSACFS